MRSTRAGELLFLPANTAAGDLSRLLAEWRDAGGDVARPLPVPDPHWKNRNKTGACSRGRSSRRRRRTRRRVIIRSDVSGVVDDAAVSW